MESPASPYESAFIHTLLETMPDIVFVKDTAGAYVFANKAFERLYGYTLEQIRGKTDFSFLSQSEAEYFTERDKEALSAGQSTVSEAWQTNELTGEKEYYETIKTPVIGPDGQAIGLLGIGRNVTQRRRAEDALQLLNRELEQRVQARAAELAESYSRLHQTEAHLQLTQNELLHREKLASLGRLVAGLSHELNTPIGTAYTVGSTLANRARSVQTAFESGRLRRREMTDFLDKVRDSAALLERTLSRAIELVADFKQVSVDQTSARRRVFDLAATVDEVVSALRVSFKGSGIALQAEVPPGLQLDSFPGKLTQVITNLAENARLHAFEGLTGGTVHIQAQDRGAQVEIGVSDDGRGIAPDVQAKVFEPFFTTKVNAGGSGIGLSIVQSLVTQGLGGTVRLESQPGQGSRFVLTLPKVASA